MIKRGHLRQFLALVDCGSFTAAASRLHVTQPTLSTGISELEKLAGATLFVRDRRALRLTDAGNRLLAHARTIEREFRLAELAVTSAPSPPAQLRLGVLASLSTASIERIALVYRGARPLTVVEGTDADLRRNLSEHRIDAAATLLRPAEAADCMLEEGYAMILPAHHRFASRPILAPEDLLGETMIARRSCEILAETSRFFTARGVRPSFSFRSSNDDRCLALVRAGAGITTGPVSLAIAGTTAVALEGYDFRRRIGLVTRPGEADALAACGIADAVRDALRTPG
jgi:DNA-binding transcriptional LysR family regulator